MASTKHHAAPLPPSAHHRAAPQRPIRRASAPDERAQGRRRSTPALPGLPHAGGEGAIGAGNYPALANENLEAGAYPVFVVVNGLKGMPPLGTYLDDEQVAAVVNYVATHFGNNYRDKVSADDVKAVRR